MTSRSDAGRTSAWDVAVIGAGPAGLAAAVAAADHGARVAVVDAEPAVGGQFWRQPAPRFEATRVREAEVAPFHHGLGQYWRLRQRLARHVAMGVATHLAGHEVWSLEAAPEPDGRPAPGGDDRGSGAARFTVHAVDAGSPKRAEVAVRARALILAPGAYDLQIPFPGWDLPGVLTAGGAQSLIKGHGVLAGRRVVVAGTGPFLLSVAAGLIRRGATVPAVVEAASPLGWLRRPRGIAAAGSKLFEGASYANTLTRHGAAYLTGWSVLRAEGTGRVSGVAVAPIASDGQLDASRARRIPTDVLAVGWGFVPQLELPMALGCETAPGAAGLPIAVADADQRSTVPGVFLAGEVCGVGGAALAPVEGEIAGLAAARDLSNGGAGGGDRAGGAHRAGASSPAPDVALLRRRIRLTRRRETLRAFADALAAVYSPPTGWLRALTDDTVVCRCEEVTAGAIREVAARNGAADARTVKLLARPGMGHCQGRMCGYAAECIAATAVGAAPSHRPPRRPVATPLPLGVLAADSAIAVAPFRHLPTRQ